jgi:hypothetical protein
LRELTEDFTSSRSADQDGAERTERDEGLAPAHTHEFLAPVDPEVAVVDRRSGEGEAAEKAVTRFLVEMVLDSTIAGGSWYERVPWTKANTSGAVIAARNGRDRP